ncbi:hypothetical protein J437_LFUL011761 [Ladona fulva]|uniref:Choline/carnitine acyltransferase domain-containing protein n=1 Tax=Ladona fulva TaxID=123851 RepID=A0A8K0KDN3_LADFU|nr:hypothetical protein J437_LFUL011761 [Ladona fulva]
MSLRKDTYISNGEKTFEFDDSLPVLPVPDLKSTLEKYLESLVPHVNETELASARNVVIKFGSGVGKELHEKLLLRAKNQKNWVEEWWEKYAYLSLREPLVPFYSMAGVSNWDDSPVPLSYEKSLRSAALYCYYLVEFWKLIREQKLKPNQNAEKQYFTMKSFRNIFNSSRHPGISVDALKSYFKTEEEGPCPSHVIVLTHGRIFIFDTLDSSGLPITPLEWESYFRQILCVCEEKGPGSGIALLTSGKRSEWAKNRQWLEALSKKNAENLHLLDNAMFAVALDKECADSESAIAKNALSGDLNNRWIDKSLNMIFFKNSVLGTLCDHAQFDGMVSIQTFHYVYLAMSETNGEWIGSKKIRDLLPPEELNFDMDSIIHQELLAAKSTPPDSDAKRKELLQKAIKKHNLLMKQGKVNAGCDRHLFGLQCVAMESGLEMPEIFKHPAWFKSHKATFTPIIARENFVQYGKDFISKQKLHPDSFVQMALQLAYYRLHRKPAPTYETATTRIFYNGRTETIRSCTVEAITWVHSMLDDKVTKNHLVKIGGGGNFMLSTSLVGYTPMGGCVAPMCLDGYGCFYNICSKSIHFSISAWRGSNESSSHKFAKAIDQSLLDMQKMLIQAASKL